MTGDLQGYFQHLAVLGQGIQGSNLAGETVNLDDATRWMLERMRECQNNRGKVMFVGNGGSAAIASHLAIDYTKNGGVPALAFNDGAALTCLGNDFGYEHVFSKQIEAHGRPGDLLVAISSSGNSANILNAVAAARAGRIAVLTLSGFGADNKLRRLGDINLYVPNDLYGFVEISHFAICHAFLDFASVQSLRDLANRLQVEEARSQSRLKHGYA
jgi:D-sedoheptulose 7-phosphate isomerase